MEWNYAPHTAGDITGGSVCSLCCGVGLARWLCMCAEGEGGGWCTRRRIWDLVLRPIAEELWLDKRLEELVGRAWACYCSWGVSGMSVGALQMTGGSTGGEVCACGALEVWEREMEELWQAQYKGTQHHPNRNQVVLLKSSAAMNALPRHDQHEASFAWRQSSSLRPMRSGRRDRPKVWTGIVLRIAYVGRDYMH